MSKIIEDLAKYCDCMEEIKERIQFVRIFLVNPTIDRNDYLYELVCLHVRKILELILFSSLVANKEKYSQAHKKYMSLWRVSELMTNLEKINPNFFPKPIIMERDINGAKHFAESDKACLTRDELTKLLSLCNKLMHVRNPYSQDERALNFELPIPEWLNKIESLLETHYVYLVDRNEVIILILSDNDGKAHAYRAEGVEEAHP
jgi:hypothetical protein